MMLGVARWSSGMIETAVVSLVFASARRHHDLQPHRVSVLSHGVQRNRHAAGLRNRH